MHDDRSKIFFGFLISPFVPSGVRLFFSQRDLNFPPQKKEREEFLF